MVPATQPRACFRRHRACGHRSTCSDCGAVIPGVRADRRAAKARLSARTPVIAKPFDAGRIPRAPALFCCCPAASIRTGAITPVLGGVGPMTITSLMHNSLIAASMRSGLAVPLLRQM
ncbi:hypothetical protein [Rhizobium laguerreae]|uniref:Tetrahydrofolate dehydrogenase/cyclohydrolase NAD(P)-binding domain-containing protein n=1 Tax=Rhizobium laguerreae TaxID=1076926 RepID=A0A6N9Z9Z6_9HYPH|nr:hypothetical protein [Rhizobium laguerreae]